MRRVLVLLLTVSSLGGCGPIAYVNEVTRRASTLGRGGPRRRGRQVRAVLLDARDPVPAQARELAAHADFQGANRFGRLAAEAAEKAVEEAAIAAQGSVEAPARARSRARSRRRRTRRRRAGQGRSRRRRMSREARSLVLVVARCAACAGSDGAARRPTDDRRPDRRPRARTARSAARRSSSRWPSRTTTSRSTRSTRATTTTRARDARIAETNAKLAIEKSPEGEVHRPGGR